MPRVIDLSVALGAPTTSQIPGHPSLRQEPIHTHEKHRRSNTKLTFSLHTGTHCDSMYHFHPGGLTIDEMPLDRCMGPALRIDLRQVAKPRTPITVQDILAQGVSQAELQGTIVISYSGYLEQNYGKPDYFLNSPYFHEETALWLVAAGIKAIGNDHNFDRGDMAATPRPGDSPEDMFGLNHRVGRRPLRLWARCRGKG